VLQQKQIRKGSAKICPIDIGVFGGARVVNVLASGAGHIDGVVAGQVGEAHREHGLALAIGARAATEVSALELFILG
jgi:hypothetical protein